MSLRRSASSHVVVALLFASPLAAATTRVVAWGDSITAGNYDGSSAANDCSILHPSAPEMCGYPGRLVSRLNALAPTFDIAAVNLGVGGESTVDALSRIGITVGVTPTCPCTGLATPCRDDSLWFWICNGTAQREDLFVLMEGTNDITRQEISLETIRFNLQSLGQKAESVGLNVVLSTLTPRHPDGFTRDLRCADDGDGDAVALNGMIAATASGRGWPLVDPSTFLRALSNLFTLYYQSWDPMKCDGLTERSQGDPVGHPNGAGFDKMTFGSDGGNYSKTFESVVKRTLPPRLSFTAPAGPLGRSVPIDFSATLFDLAQTAALSWNFGDGTIVVTHPVASPAVQSHTYAQDGPYTVVVTAEHANGGARNASAVIEIGVGAVAGDIDGSGRVDGADLVRLALAFGAQLGQARFDPDADLDGNRRIDGADLALLAANFGRSSA